MGISLFENLFFFMRAQHVLNYHLIRDQAWTPLLDGEWFKDFAAGKLLIVYTPFKSLNRLHDITLFRAFQLVKHKYMLKVSNCSGYCNALGGIACLTYIFTILKFSICNPSLPFRRNVCIARIHFKV